MTSPQLQEIVTCMGQPVAGNPTQFMMEKAFESLGLDWRYLTLEVPPENLGDAVRGMRAMGFRGGNFTIPHKVKVIEFLDSLSQAAELMGAVNCVHQQDGKLTGENTDGKGFVQSLSELTSPVGKEFVILGAGGAARAIAVELALSKASKLWVVNRSAPRGNDLANMIVEKTSVPAEFVLWEGSYHIPETADVVVNATSIGLGDAAARVPLETSTWLPTMIACDVIFNPPATVFLREAGSRGCKTLDGLGMLVNQAVIGFKIWTGLSPKPSVMREALEEYLEL